MDHDNIEGNKFWVDQVGLLFILIALGKQLLHTVYSHWHTVMKRTWLLYEAL